METWPEYSPRRAAKSSLNDPFFVALQIPGIGMKHASLCQNDS